MTTITRFGRSLTGRLAVTLAILRIWCIWPRLAAGAGIGRRVEVVSRFRWTKATPLAVQHVENVTHRTHTRFKDVPRLSHWGVTPYGWRARVTLRLGDDLDTYTDVTEKLRHGCRAETVRIYPDVPGFARLVVVRRNPFNSPPSWGPAAVGVSTSIRVAVVDDGTPFLLEFRKLPHWLVVGATNSGKSSILTALFAGVAPTNAAIMGIDCKWGVEQWPLRNRLTELAMTPREALVLMDRVLDLVGRRAAECKAAGVKSVWDLPGGDENPSKRPVFLLVDEVAELLLITGDDKDMKDTAKRMSTQLLRLVQLVRAFGVFVILAGQRFGSDLGPTVTAIRAQLAGRIVCRTADGETAKMALNDLAEDAIEAAQLIDPAMPGIAIAAGGPTGWTRIRSLNVSTADVRRIANEYADLTPAWEDLLPNRTPIPLDDIPVEVPIDLPIAA